MLLYIMALHPDRPSPISSQGQFGPRRLGRSGQPFSASCVAHLGPHVQLSPMCANRLLSVISNLLIHFQLYVQNIITIPQLTSLFQCCQFHICQLQYKCQSLCNLIRLYYIKFPAIEYFTAVGAVVIAYSKTIVSNSFFYRKLQYQYSLWILGQKSK